MLLLSGRLAWPQEAAEVTIERHWQLLIPMCLTCCSAKPSAIFVTESPGKTLRYTLEEYRSEDPLTSDYSRVYVSASATTSRELVLSGDYIKLSNVRFTSERKGILCVNGGHIDRYNSQVVIHSEDAELPIQTVIVKC
jgi:hypothetical protein